MDNLIGALDVNGKNDVVIPDKVCGAATVLFDGSYPVGVHYFSWSQALDQEVTVDTLILEAMYIN